MDLTLPVPTTTLGPEWATELNVALTTVDAHDHTPGKGTPVPVTGLDINDDLSFNGHEIQAADTIKFNDSAAVKTGLTDIRNVYPVNGDLYYNNGTGVAVQITSGNSIATPSSPVVPAGIISAFGGISAPSGYLLCDGSAVSQATYATLFAAIGTTYNTGGEGIGNFRLPNATGRALVGAGTYTDPVLGSITRTLAESSGAASHVLVTGEMPVHNHTTNDPGHSHTLPYKNPTPVGGVDVTGWVPNTGVVGNFTTSTATTGVTTNNNGGGGAHNNMQPFLVINYIIKT